MRREENGHVNVFSLGDTISVQSAVVRQTCDKTANQDFIACETIRKHPSCIFIAHDATRPKQIL
jgi:hypothetical protein